uniref:Uncharacterized protein n=1 Tax=Anopheles minimus TaxID=112268 RepID=A0A182WPC3_9DIPT
MTRHFCLEKDPRHAEFQQLAISNKLSNQSPKRICYLEKRMLVCRNKRLDKLLLSKCIKRA